MRNLNTNRLLSVILSLVLMLSLLPTMIYAETTELAAGTVAKETIVTPVAGQTNTFDVTLRAYGRNSATAGKDIILLLDCSGSMGTDPFTALKSTATEFVNSVLKDSTSTERIAIVTFADNATIKNNFTGYADKQALLTTIADMTSVGGTHTQGALRQAIKLLDTTTKDTAVIMLSDGAPQNCYPLLAKFKDYQTPMPYRNTATNKPNIAQDPLYLTWHQSRDMDYSYYQDSGSASAFAPYSYYYIDQAGVQRDSGSLNYTIAALAESDVLNTKTSNVYTIAYNLSDQSGIDTLKDIASDSSKAYTASTSNVSSILSEISGLVIDAGSILKDGKIEKVSAPGFTVSNVGTVGSSYTLNGSNLTWTITKLNTPTSGVTGLKYSGNDVFYSELKFRLTATDSVLINPKDSEGKYNLLFSDPLNLSYTNLSNSSATLDFGNAYVELARTPAPVITPPKTTDTSITGNGTPGAVVTVTLPDNSTIEATVGQDGNWTAPLPAGTTLNVDDKITASAKETDKLTSPITEATVIDGRTDTQKYDPQGKTQTVELNATPDVKNSISNLVDLPTDATFAYKNPVDTSTVGDKNATVVVTYKDGTKDEVAVIVNVIDSRTDNLKYDPQGKTQTVELNATPDVKTSISNLADLPTDATFAYKNPVDTSTVGDKNAIVVVTYKDGTTDEVAVIVKVIDSRTDNQKYDPQGKTQTVELNATPDVKTSISNLADLPTDATFAYKNPVDTSTVGDKNATVVVTYKDGTTDEVAVIVKVIDSRGLHENHNPLGKTQTVELNTKPDVKNSISNTVDLPEGTTLAYSRTVDTSTVGDKNAIVIVTYQDGTKDEVAVIVKVINSQTNNSKPISPKTGNNQNILLSIVLLCSSIAIPVGMIAIKKRSKTIR